MYDTQVHMMTQSCPTLAAPWTVARQAPLSMGFSKKEYWSGLPFPSPGDLPNLGIEPMSPALAGRFITTGHMGFPSWRVWITNSDTIFAYARMEKVS